MSSRWYRQPLTLALAVFYFLSLTGCGSQPQVSSAESMSLIKKFYTAANSKNDSRLKDCEADFAKLKQAAKLSEKEIESFDKILGLAKSGQWEQAQELALSFAEAQVR